METQPNTSVQVILLFSNLGTRREVGNYRELISNSTIQILAVRGAPTCLDCHVVDSIVVLTVARMLVTFKRDASAKPLMATPRAEQCERQYYPLAQEPAIVKADSYCAH